MTCTKPKIMILEPLRRDIAASRLRQADLQAEAIEKYQSRNNTLPVTYLNNKGRGDNDEDPVTYDKNGKGRADLAVGDKIWVRIRVIHKNSGREHWTGPATIAAITGKTEDGTEVLSVKMEDGGVSRVTRAKIRKIPPGVTLEKRTGAEITECSSWESGKPVSHYKIRIKYPDGTTKWEEASTWLRRPEFQMFALTMPYLSHLVIAVGDA